MKQSADKRHWGGGNICSSSLPQPLPPVLRAAKQGKTPPKNNSSREKREARSWDGGRFMPGAGSCLSLRDFVCQHCRLESRTPGLPVKATAASRHFAVQPRVGSAALPTAIPCSCSLSWLLSFSRNNPNLNSFPQDTNAFPPSNSCRHQYFPPLLDVCPHARKLKLPIAGSDYAPSVQGVKTTSGCCF